MKCPEEATLKTQKIHQCLQELGGRGTGSAGCQVSIWGDENVLKPDGHEGCTTMGTYLMPLTVHFKMVKMGPLGRWPQLVSV